MLDALIQAEIIRPLSAPERRPRPSQGRGAPMPLGVPDYRVRPRAKLPSPLPSTVPRPSPPSTRPSTGGIGTPRTLREFSDQLMTLEDTGKIRNSQDVINSALEQRMSDSISFLIRSGDLADVDDEPKKRRVRAKWSRI